MRLDFIRRADWLEPGRVRGYLWIFALLNLATFVFLLATSRNGVDRNGFLLGTDFLSFWTVGQMLHKGANVYDIAAHIAAQREFFAARDGFTAFFYPPAFLPFCYPLGWLSYFPALGVWLLATGGAFALVARMWLTKLDIRFPLWLLLLAFPPALISITHGQTSFLVAALLGLGALLVPERPFVAGLLFGLATIKPQFGVLIPVVLLFTGNWRAIGGAIAGALALALLSTVAFGPQIWADWLAVSGQAQAAMDQGTVGYAKMQSMLAALLLLSMSSGIAYAVQAALSLGVAGALAVACWKKRYTLAHGAAMLAGAPLVTPFVLDYDMLLLAFPIAYLAGTGLRPWEKFTAALAFAVPAFARPLAVSLGISVMPLVMIALFVLTLRRAMEQDRKSAISPPLAVGVAPAG
jgi:hypothetical protein